MLSPHLRSRIAGLVAGTAAKNALFQPVAGGSINETMKVEVNGRTAFCKVNNAVNFPQLFRKEKSGLELLVGQGIIRTPKVIGLMEEEGYQILILEWIGTGERNKAFWKEFGSSLAALHAIKGPFFGLEEDNYMGSVQQENEPSPSWTEFFHLNRIEPLLRRCEQHGSLDTRHLARFETLLSHLDDIFGKEDPVLLHGDLWSGNFMCSEVSQPVLIDPAVYYGHPSMDLGMTRLFGGFHSLFYEAYRYHKPFPENHEEQWKVCNLYPLLIHLYLFGPSYLSGIEDILDDFS